MPWFREVWDVDRPKHPAVFFNNAEDFWKWREDRPFDNEMWEGVDQDEERLFAGRQIVPIPRVDMAEGFQLAENPALQLDIGLARAEDAGIVHFDWNNDPRPAVPPAPPVEREWEERDWDNLSTEEKLEWLLEQPDPAPIFKEVLEHIHQLENNKYNQEDDERWNAGYDVGFDDGIDEGRAREREGD